MIERSITITGLGATITKLDTYNICHKSKEGRTTYYTDYTVQVSIDAQHREASKYLRLEYITSSTYWVPRYALSIQANGGATLTLEAELQLQLPESKLPIPQIIISNVSAKYNHSPLDEYTRQLRLLERQDAKRNGRSLELYPSQIVPENWRLDRLNSTKPTLRIMELRNVIPPVILEGKPYVEHITAKLKSKHSMTLPSGSMDIYLDNYFLKSIRTPNWNPDELINIPLCIKSNGPSLKIAHPGPPAPPSDLGPSDDRYEAAHNLLYLSDPVASCQNLKPLNIMPAPIQKAPRQDVDLSSSTRSGPPCMKDNPESPTEPRTPLVSDIDSMPTESTSYQSPRYKPGRRSESRVKDKGICPISRSDTKARQSTHSNKRHWKKARPSQCSDSAKRYQRVGFLASKICRNSAVYEWDGIKNGWKCVAEGEITMVEVYVEGDNDNRPIRLSPWMLDKMWKGMYREGEPLMVTHDEILRLVRAGTAVGQGMLETSYNHHS